jgi:signal transduction histidine kinase/DNA-binding response OmpR family regulator
LEHCENAIVLTDPSLRAWYANEAFAALSGRTMCSAAGTTIVDALAHRIADGETFARSLHELTLHVEQEAAGEITRLGTPARTFEWRSVPLRGIDGSVSGRGFLFHDRSQARELAGLKGDFLSTVAHELRTPLTSVKGSLQLVLGKSTALSPIDCELLNISLKNADRLIRLINDLLDISRLELGKIELTFTKVPTASLVEEAVAGLRAYAGAREITIGCEIVADVPALEGDRDRLIQVLTNLISNAVKFSPARGHVLVRAARLGDEVAITVRDWGIGIRTVDQSRLFQRFQRLDPGHSDEPGTGLGLAISKAIVDRHGGRITLTSGENAGSTFTIMVPAVKETPVPSSDRRKRDASAGGPPTILLIDDDQNLGATLERAWHDRYRLLRVERGIEALDTARQARPDLVLLDVVLPDLSGYDVLRILRTTVATSAIPVIMLTVQPERALATNLGAVDVVGKPLDLDRLTYAVEHALQERHTDTGLCIAVGPCNARREELIATLRSHGHTVLEAHDALDLLRCADDHVPDVAVVGLDPTSDGPERTLTLLRNHPSTRSLPVVLLSERQTGAPAVNGCTWMEPGANDEAVLRAVERAGRRRVIAA